MPGDERNRFTTRQKREDLTHVRQPAPSGSVYSQVLGRAVPAQAGVEAPPMPEPVAQPGSEAVLGPLLERIVQARSLAKGALTQGKALGGGATGVDDVAGARRAKQMSLQSELRAKDDEALMAELQALPSRPGAPMWRETGDPLRAQALMDRLVSSGMNAGIDEQGRITWGTPSAPTPEAAPVPQQQAQAPALSMQRMSQLSLLLERLGRAANNDALPQGAREAAMRQAEAIGAMLSGAQQGGAGAGAPPELAGVEDLLGGFEGALGGGLRPSGPRQAQEYAMARDAFRRGFRREPTEQELYALWAERHGVRGGRR